MCVSLNLIKSVYSGGCMSWFCVRVCVFMCGIAMATQYSHTHTRTYAVSSACKTGLYAYYAASRSHDYYGEDHIFCYVSLPKHSACRTRSLDMNPLPAEAARCRTSLN